MAGWARLILGPALLLHMASGVDCRLDQAQITTVPPTTFRVVATYQCGALVCWRRWVEVDGKVVGESQACGQDGSDKINVR